MERKGKTLAQIEAEEGGPVKESLVGMAQSKRAHKRKGGGVPAAAVVGDTDLVEDVEGVEEDLEVGEEEERGGGVKLEAFNLKVCVGGGRLVVGWAGSRRWPAPTKQPYQSLYDPNTLACVLTSGCAVLLHAVHAAMCHMGAGGAGEGLL